jgi:hypothetical protein
MMFFDPNDGENNIPKLNASQLAKLGLAEQRESLEAKYTELYRNWFLGSHETRANTEEGRWVTSVLLQCLEDDLKLIILSDDAEKFKGHTAALSDQKEAYWFEIACFFGSQKIGESLMDKIDLTLSKSDLESGSEVLTKIVSSGNLAWAKAILAEHSISEIPDYAFNFAASMPSPH